jgi:hypothetical protein
LENRFAAEGHERLSQIPRDRCASVAALAGQFARRPIDQMQARTGRTPHGQVRVVDRLVTEPILHVHAGLRASEDDLSVHTFGYDAKAALAKLRMFT